MIELIEKTKTASDIINTAYVPPTQIIENFITEGCGPLCGKAKMGKSILANSMAVSVATGRPFLEKFSVTQGKVLYLALEDTEAQIQRRLLRLNYCVTENDNLHYRTTWPTYADGGLEAIDRWVEESITVQLVIIDTLARFIGFKKSGTYMADYKVMTSLKNLANRAGIGLLVLHHMRKDTPQDIYDAISGSSGLSAGADSVLILTRERGASNATIFVSGRELKESKYALELDEPTLSWKLLGSADEFNLTSARREILEYLRAKETPVLLQQIAQDLRKKKPVLHKLLGAMRHDGLVTHQEGGLYQYKAEVAVTANSVNAVNADNVVAIRRDPV